MDPITQQVVLATAGAAGAGEATYVDDVFSTYVYEGTGAAKTITNGIDLSGEGGLVWIKQRDESRNHSLYDTERGVLKQLYSNASNGQAGASGNDLDGFNSDGFSLGTDTFSLVNKSGGDYVSWSFRKAPGFFDIVTYTGTGVARTISHNLGSVPGLIITKCTSHSDLWQVYHRSLGASSNLVLNATDAAQSDGVFGGTTPTDSVFSLSAGYSANYPGRTFVAYVFAHDDQSFGTNSDESIIKCGSFTTPSSGSFDVDLGFEPQWLMIKSSSSGSAGSWVIRDVMRGWDKAGFKRLFANSNQAENVWTSSEYFPINNTGFSSNTDWLGANTTYVYMAIRRPHKPPTAGTEVFTATNPTSSGTYTVTAGFPVDSVWYGGISNTDKWYVADRLRGSKLLRPNLQDIESSITTAFDSMTQFILPTVSGDYSGQISYCFKRAPGFFDVVAYTGTGTNSSGTEQVVNHNLGVAPELVIVKNRDYAKAFFVWSIYMTEQYRMQLNDTAQEFSGGDTYWQANSTFTATQFGLGYGVNTNRSPDKHVAYLFASLDGISKVGTYTGTGNNVNVDCGFASGARFVLIKRKDAEVMDGYTAMSGWYVWDSTRGIVSGNDPYLRIDKTDAQVTNTDYIDPLNAGFTVTSSASASLNASGGTYLFLAIA